MEPEVEREPFKKQISQDAVKVVSPGDSHGVVVAYAFKRRQRRTGVAGVAADLPSLAQLPDLEVGREERSANLLTDRFHVLALLCGTALLGAAHD